MKAHSNNLHVVDDDRPHLLLGTTAWMEDVARDSDAAAACKLEPDVTAEAVLNSSYNSSLNDSASSLRRRHVHNNNNGISSKDQENDLPGHGLVNILQQNSITSREQPTHDFMTEHHFAARSNNFDNNNDADSLIPAVAAEPLDINGAKTNARSRVSFKDAQFERKEPLSRRESKESHLSV